MRHETRNSYWVNLLDVNTVETMWNKDKLLLIEINSISRKIKKNQWKLKTSLDYKENKGTSSSKEKIISYK